MDIPNNAHVLVVDGRKLLLFRNGGDAQDPSLEVVTHDEQASLATNEIGSDAPGTSQSSVGSGRSSYQQTDYHQQDEDKFVAGAADLLKKLALTNKIQKLIVVAPPRALGEMRKHYHKAVEAVLIGEIAKDVAGRSTPDIEMVIKGS